LRAVTADFNSDRAVMNELAVLFSCRVVYSVPYASLLYSNVWFIESGSCGSLNDFKPELERFLFNLGLD
jgi:hypothetical protein